jgi:hypothetical protein
MSQKHKKVAQNALDGVGVDELTRLLSMLGKELNAKKRVFFVHQGVVICSREVPDHKTRLRAAIELGKLHDLFPQRGGREARELFDRTKRPNINLVILDPDAR